MTSFYISPYLTGIADYGNGLLEHFDSMSPHFNGTAFKSAAETMIREGYTFDYVSDLQIENTVFYESLLQTEGNIYKTLIVPDCKYIPVETFGQILMLANEGATIIFYGNFPGSISGWADKDGKTRFFNRLKAGINLSPTNNPEILKAVYGNGRILSGNDIEQLLTFAGIPRETMTDEQAGFYQAPDTDRNGLFHYKPGRKHI